ncbi:MAG TPA: hypothetical protein VF551_08630, partial [Chthoniobacterales bacterium]
MRLARAFILALIFALVAPLAVGSEIAPVVGLNALPEVAWSALSHRDTSALGAKALAIRAQDWKHGETEHFIYHFQRSYVATPISVEAEFHFRVVSKELGKSDAVFGEKAHIYIFEQPADWESFQS